MLAHPGADPRALGRSGHPVLGVAHGLVVLLRRAQAMQSAHPAGPSAAHCRWERRRPRKRRTSPCRTAPAPARGRRGNGGPAGATRPAAGVRRQRSRPPGRARRRRWRTPTPRACVPTRARDLLCGRHCRPGARAAAGRCPCLTNALRTAALPRRANSPPAMRNLEDARGVIVVSRPRAQRAGLPGQPRLPPGPSRGRDLAARSAARRYRRLRLRRPVHLPGREQRARYDRADGRRAYDLSQPGPQPVGEPGSKAARPVSTSCTGKTSSRRFPEARVLSQLISAPARLR